MSTAHTTFTAKPWRSRLLIAGLFWMLCLTLSAAGHRLYKATVTVDRHVSAVEYRAEGARLVWVGPRADRGFVAERRGDYST